jgi:hypothetical protein
MIDNIPESVCPFCGAPKSDQIIKAEKLCKNFGLGITPHELIQIAKELQDGI